MQMSTCIYIHIYIYIYSEKQREKCTLIACSHIYIKINKYIYNIYTIHPCTTMCYIYIYIYKYTYLSPYINTHDWLLYAYSKQASKHSTKSTASTASNANTTSKAKQASKRNNHSTAQLSTTTIVTNHITNKTYSKQITPRPESTNNFCTICYMPLEPHRRATGGKRFIHFAFDKVMLRFGVQCQMSEYELTRMV